MADPALTGLDAPLTALRSIAPRMMERLEYLGLRCVCDLLFHLPLRYQDRTRIVPIGALRIGDQAIIEGDVQHTAIKFGKRRMLITRIADGSGGLNLRFFHFNAAQKKALARGTRLRCFGEVRRSAGTTEMIHPEYRRITGDEVVAVDEHFTPIYPTTEGLQQAGLRRLAEQALERLERSGLPELLPPEMPGLDMLPSLVEALRFLHHPPPDTPLTLLEEGQHPAQQRLIIEELLAHQLSLRRLRAQMNRHPAPALVAAADLSTQFITSLPFQLTDAQRRVAEEITADISQPHPMQRLVQGDVGSGKTVVAALATLQAVENDMQAVIMAPTELLAEQHYHTFSQWFEPLGVAVGWISGRRGVKRRRAVLEAFADGTVQVAVGTHALFQEGVEFKRLGLVVIDEQHRFGVHQRFALREKGVCDDIHPHQLIMTATPIPRTLAQIAYADLDISIIDELPPGRTPVETVVISNERRPEVVERIRSSFGDGRQSYWVCTLIEESDSLQAQAAEETAAGLSATLDGMSVELIHGRMKAAEKERIMAAFNGGDIDLLVATTVIEVGVDVPNASLMIIENAERLGLAQLHQLRGRVGRGARKSSCVLLYQPPLSDTARARLAILRATNDGFEIARKDLDLRGPGELLGTRQTGMQQFRIADLRRDRALLDRVVPMADWIMRHAPECVDPLVDRWFGDNRRYADT